jgi:hypothetical protein
MIQSGIAQDTPHGCRHRKITEESKFASQLDPMDEIVAALTAALE